MIIGECRLTHCDRPKHARGLCKTHYERARIGLPLVPVSRKEPVPCTFAECDRRSVSRGLCAGHAWQRNRGHDLTPIVKITAKLCSFDQCDRAPQSRGRWAGLCSAHAKQKRATGVLQPFKDGPPLRDPETFMTRVDKRPSGCWEWTSNITPAGYGTLSLGNKRYGYAHRFSWEMHRGAIPDGLTIDHLCRNRRCVNPDHLEPVTQAENSRRAWAHRREITS